MNIIRTPAVELTAIPAVAYKQKLASGGSGLKILRLDQDASAVFTIDRRTGDSAPYGKVDSELFPDTAVDEALEATSGLPYSSRGKIRITSFELPAEEEDVQEDDTEKIDMVGSDEYKAIVDRYSDEKGKMNYQLMNKDFIQFAAGSKVVASMVADKADPKDILHFIVKSRATLIANKKESLSDKEIDALIETLDEIDPRSAFKELNNYIRRLLARRK